MPPMFILNMHAVERFPDLLTQISPFARYYGAVHLRLPHAEDTNIWPENDGNLFSVRKQRLKGTKIEGLYIVGSPEWSQKDTDKHGIEMRGCKFWAERLATGYIQGTDSAVLWREIESDCNMVERLYATDGDGSNPTYNFLKGPVLVGNLSN